MNCNGIGTLFGILVQFAYHIDELNLPYRCTHDPFISKRIIHSWRHDINVMDCMSFDCSNIFSESSNGSHHAPS